MSGETDLIKNDVIVEQLIEDGLPRKCIDYQFSKLCKTQPWKRQYQDDMYQDLIVILYEYNNEKLNDAYRNKHLNALITRIILNSIYSASSKFYNTYIKFNARTDDLDKVEVEDEE